MYKYFLFLFLLCHITVQANEVRTALVIGNSNYDLAPLLNPKNDAEDISNSLKKLGFDVILITDASLREMDEAAVSFGKKLGTQQGVGLFFYAGHGVQSKGRNYLIPINSNLKSESDLKYKAFDAGKVLDEMGYAENGLNIVILDACRNNPLSRSFRSSRSGLARPNDVPSGTLIAYSTAPGMEASDGKGRNSPYTQALLNSMQEQGKPLETVFKNVIKHVKQATQGKQIPWVSSSVDGDFYFAGRASSDIDKVYTDKAQQKNILLSKVQQPNVNIAKDYEILYWESVMDKPNQAKLSAYMAKYPNGHFRAIAINELVLLKKAKQRTIETSVSTKSLLSQCKVFVESYHLTSGKNGNAYDCYQSILDKEPSNAKARAGMYEVELAYIRLAEKYLKQKNLKKTDKNIKKLQRINSTSRALPDLQQRYTNLKEIVNFSQLDKSKVVTLNPVKEREQIQVSSEQQHIFNEYYHVIEDLLASEALTKKEINKIRKYLDKLRKINPDSDELKDVSSRFNNRFK